VAMYSIRTIPFKFTRCISLTIRSISMQVYTLYLYICLCLITISRNHINSNSTNNTKTMLTKFIKGNRWRKFEEVPRKESNEVASIKIFLYPKKLLGHIQLLYSNLTIR
jgi:hypothetical protein